MFEPQFLPTPLYTTSSTYTPSSTSSSSSSSLSSSVSNNNVNKHSLIINYPPHLQQSSSSGGRVPRLVDRSGGPILLTDPIFNSAGSTAAGSSSLIFDNNNRVQPQRRSRMNAFQTNVDFEAQQEAARRFEPELIGPLVARKKSSHAITEEYARADPVYITKTQALPNTYSHYRAILGDGNCGWRAIAFCYYETLQKLGDKALVEAEIQRLTSMNAMLEASGFDITIFEDFQDEALQLLRDVAGSIYLGPPTDSNSIVLQRFNDANSSSPIIYYFRLLASSWINLYPDNYAGFIADGMTVDEYRNDVLQPVATQMDHVAMTLLVDVLLKPINVRTEVVYLDRSPGPEVNSHIMESLDANSLPLNPNGPLIHLLYRPGHYDILYKESSSMLVRQPQIMQQDLAPVIRRVASIGHQQWEAAPSYSSAPWELGLLAEIPGMSMGMGFGGPPSNQYFPALNDCSMPNTGYALSPSTATAHSMSPTSPAIAFSDGPLSLHSMPSTQSQQIGSSHGYASSQHSISMPLPPTSPSDQSVPPMSRHQSFSSHHHHSPITPLEPPHQRQGSQSYPPPQLPTTPISPGIGPSHSLAASRNDIMRPSRYQVESEFAQPQPPPLQTTTFRNSHYNKCHYANADFTPEQWRPEDNE